MGFEITEAIADLKKFERIQDQVEFNADVRLQILDALDLVRQKSDYQMFGVLADTYQEAIAAIADYAKAYEYEIPKSPDALDGPIYLKYNPSTRLCYCDTYTGDHRGVLISFQSNYEDGINEMFGHFPLDLYS